MNVKHMTLSAMVLGACAALTACSGSTKSGTEYTMTPLRELKVTLPHDLTATHAASVRAVRDRLGYTVEQESSDALEGIITARSATDREVTVSTRKVGESSTRVLVGVSPMGDEDIARSILSAIEDELK